MCAADILWWYLITYFIKVYMQGVYQKLLAMYVPVLVGLYNINWKESNNNLWRSMLVLKMMFHFILELFSNYSEKLSVKTWCGYQDSYCSNIKYNVTLSNMIIQNASKERYNCFYWVLFYLFLSILNPYGVI